MSVKRLFAAAALIGLVLAGTASAQTLVDLDYVKQAAARGALLWDARDEDAFAKGHLPGAVNVGDPTLTLRDTLTEDYLPQAALERVFGYVGLDPAREIIVYGDRGLPSTYFAAFTLRYFGAHQVRVFHDGIDAWREAGLALDRKADTPKSIKLKLTPQPALIASTKEVVAALKRPDVQLLDVRSPKEFKGEDVRAIRGGHIPGAINIPFEQNWQDPDTRNKLRQGLVKDTGGMALKSREALARLYAGLDPGKEIIVYCQSGNRAAQTAVVLADLGFKNVRIFDSSWLGYASWLSAPADDEVWTNFGSLPNAVKVLENRFGELEKQSGKR